jgi:putative transposase
MVTILREANEKPSPRCPRNTASAHRRYTAGENISAAWSPPTSNVSENGRLKKLVAERDLELEVLKEITRKNGRRTPAPAAGRVCPIGRSVEPPRVRLALRRAIDPLLAVPARHAGRAGRGGDAPPGGAVPAVRVSTDSDLLAARRTRDEYGSDQPSGGVATTTTCGRTARSGT